MEYENINIAMDNWLFYGIGGLWVSYLFEAIYLSHEISCHTYVQKQENKYFRVLITQSHYNFGYSLGQLILLKLA